MKPDLECEFYAAIDDGIFEGIAHGLAITVVYIPWAYLFGWFPFFEAALR